MEMKRAEVSRDETLVEVVARLVKLQKRIASDCEELNSKVIGPKPMGLTPKGDETQVGKKGHSKSAQTVASSF